MGNVVNFRRRPQNRGQFRGQGNWQRGKGPGGPGKRKRSDFVSLLLAIVGLVSLAGLWWSVDAARAEQFSCQSTRVIDGDTFDCDGMRIRMVGIDAPELPGHCRPGRECTPGDPFASTDHLRQLMSAGGVECQKTDLDSYGRVVARCKAGNTDLSCAQVRDGFAVKRYAVIWCRD
jgi:endonuclease YncB( thermonuclease family)